MKIILLFVATLLTSCYKSPLTAKIYSTCNNVIFCEKLGVGLGSGKMIDLKDTLNWNISDTLHVNKSIVLIKFLTCGGAYSFEEKTFDNKSKTAGFYKAGKPVIDTFYFINPNAFDLDFKLQEVIYPQKDGQWNTYKNEKIVKTLFYKNGKLIDSIIYIE